MKLEYLYLINIIFYNIKLLNDVYNMNDLNNLIRFKIKFKMLQLHRYSVFLNCIEALTIYSKGNNFQKNYKPKQLNILFKKNLSEMGL